jgi:hypothetical protein
MYISQPIIKRHHSTHLKQLPINRIIPTTTNSCPSTASSHPPQTVAHHSLAHLQPTQQSTFLLKNRIC